MHYNNFDVYHYLIMNENHDTQFIGLQEFIVKTQVYYLIKFEKIYGTLTIFPDHLTFEPDLKCQENYHLTLKENNLLLQRRKLSDYRCIVHFLDIQEINLMPLINETACLSTNKFIKENYKDDIFIQILLGSVNGISLRQGNRKDGELGAVIDEEDGNKII
jgi:hypothetical protein